MGKPNEVQGGGLTYDGLASHTGIVRIPSSPPPPPPPIPISSRNRPPYRILLMNHGKVYLLTAQPLKT